MVDVNNPFGVPDDQYGRPAFLPGGLQNPAWEGDHPLRPSNRNRDQDTVIAPGNDGGLIVFLSAAFVMCIVLLIIFMPPWRGENTSTFSSVESNKKATPDPEFRLADKRNCSAVIGATVLFNGNQSPVYPSKTIELVIGRPSSGVTFPVGTGQPIRAIHSSKFGDDWIVVQSIEVSRLAPPETHGMPTCGLIRRSSIAVDRSKNILKVY